MSILHSTWSKHCGEDKAKFKPANALLNALFSRDFWPDWALKTDSFGLQLFCKDRWSIFGGNIGNQQVDESFWLRSIESSFPLAARSYLVKSGWNPLCSAHGEH